MSQVLPPASAAFLVALGAVPGAWLRYRVVDHFEPLLPRKHWGTFGVNVIACFALGLLVGLEESCGESAKRVLLILGTGFLGSFSTFSTFSVELLQAWLSGSRRQAAALLFGSVLAGLLAMALGLWLGAGTR